MKKSGNLFWLTGLSGAGKTVIGRELYLMLKEKNLNTLFLDGDELRVVFGAEGKHSIEDRYRLAMSYAKLCKLLTDQGINVVCATISMFSECRNWCRDNVQGYREIYVRVPIETLIRRDKKGLYSGVTCGEISNVVGIDLPFEEPECPFIVVDNGGEQAPREIAEWMLRRLEQVVQGK